MHKRMPLRLHRRRPSQLALFVRRFFCRQLLLQKLRAFTHRCNLFEHKVTTQVIRASGGAETAVGACHNRSVGLATKTLGRRIFRSGAIFALALALRRVLSLALALRQAQRDHILAQALLDQLGVLHMGGGGVDYAGEERLFFRHVHSLFSPHLMFVCVPGVASLNGEKLGPRIERDVGNLLQRHVVVVRAGIVAPAHVHAEFGGVEGGHRLVQNLHVPLGHLLEFFQGFVLVPCVPTHPQVRAIQL
mmetsp:Transcript_125958/g.350925  ORF Transcript_125958/g.350925 Transcript_125958/m.350925 type:complete len:247 (+) Transcript_125958:174-914(+)